MGDGKALQMGTSHELGQNFARPFDITYTNASGSLEYVWQTSWGVSTRLVGALVMGHGDDFGLRLPPALAPVQVVVLVVKDSPEVRAAADGAGRRAPGGGAPGPPRRPHRHQLRPAQRGLGAQGRARAGRGRSPRPGRGQRDRGRPPPAGEAERRPRRPWRTTVAAVLAGVGADAPGRGDGGPGGPDGRRRPRSRRPSRRGQLGFARVRLGALGPDGEDRLAAARAHRPLPAAARRVAGRSRATTRTTSSPSWAGRINPGIAIIQPAVHFKISTSLKRGLRPTLSLCGGTNRRRDEPRGGDGDEQGDDGPGGRAVARPRGPGPGPGRRRGPRGPAHRLRRPRGRRRPRRARRGHPGRLGGARRASTPCRGATRCRCRAPGSSGGCARRRTSPGRSGRRSRSGSTRARPRSAAITGTLVAADETGCTLAGPEVPGGEVRVAYDQIERARTVFEWGPEARRAKSERVKRP